MSPVRREDDYRRRPIKDWDTYTQDAIDEAIERGEFDNNPYEGKPIRIESNPHAPELDFAFSRLKNAGYKPAWMELDEEINQHKADLEIWLAQQIQYIRTWKPVPPQPPRKQSLLKRLLFGNAAEPDHLEPLTHDELLDRIRTQYLQKSSDLDAKIKSFNDAIGSQLWHLERMRITPERALATFENAMTESPSEQ